MSRWHLYVADKDCGEGLLAVDTAGNAYFFAAKGSACRAEMKGIRLLTASSGGIQLAGFQPAGFAKNGAEKFTYQEWWLKYPEVKP